MSCDCVTTMKTYSILTTSWTGPQKVVMNTPCTYAANWEPLISTEQSSGPQVVTERTSCVCVAIGVSLSLICPWPGPRTAGMNTLCDSVMTGAPPTSTCL